MKLSWIDYLIILVVVLVAILASRFALPQTVDGKEVKTHFFTTK